MQADGLNRGSLSLMVLEPPFLKNLREGEQAMN